MDGQVLSLPAGWIAELNDESALVADPDGRAAVLDEMAYAAHRRRDVSAEDLVDMLELSEAARYWALMEFEGAVTSDCASTSRQRIGSDEPSRIIVGRTPG